MDGEDLPHGVQLVYQDGGPQYSVERYLPVWHHEKTAELLDVSYEALLEYFTREDHQPEVPVPDGGQQLENRQPDTIWFWYDPTADMILQEEVEPYNVVGLFENEDDADRFIEIYAERYGLEDASRLEKYSAALSYQGQGPVLEEDDKAADPAKGREQSGFDEFL